MGVGGIKGLEEDISHFPVHQKKRGGIPFPFLPHL